MGTRARGGKAVAQILFGETSPNGRLPVTFYASTEDLPDFADYGMENRTYRYFKGRPLYPFGYGLSYTKIVYKNAQVSSEETNIGQGIRVTVDVENTGDYMVHEPVQIYLKDVEASTRVPNWKLCGFTNICLELGEGKRVSMELKPRDFAFIAEDGSCILESTSVTIGVRIKTDWRTIMFVSEKMYELGSKRSAIRELFEYGKQRAAVVGPENVYDFSLGNPSIPAPESVNASIRELTEELNSISLHGYTSAQGDLQTRQVIADYLNKTHGTNFHGDNFYMTMGAAASLSICFKALTTCEEDEFIVNAPFFPEYTVFIQAAGAKPVIVPADTENFQINFEALEKCISTHTKGIVINSPNNPSGAVYSRETIQKLADLCSKKSKEFGTEIFILADEPYREIAYDGVEVPFGTKYYNNTLVCYSYSKSLSLPGERIGWILVPDQACESKMVYAAVAGAGRALGYVCAPSLFQKMLVKCMGQTGDVNEYKKNRDLLYEGLTRIGYKCFKPDGAFYMFVQALEEDADAFCEKAKEEDLLVVSATGFGCPGYVRISYCVDGDMIQRSFRAFERLYQKYQK